MAAPSQTAGRLAVLGAGQMGTALVAGLLRVHAWAAADVALSGRRAAPLAAAAQRLGVAAAASAGAAVAGAAVVVIAVKPGDVAGLLAEIAPSLPAAAQVVSLAAGVPRATLASALGGPARLSRAMPNVAVAHAAGATALCGGDATVRALFTAVGLCVPMAESQLDAAAALCGSGPAYLLLVAEALADAGVAQGLQRADAQALAAQVLAGAAALLQQPGAHPAPLRDAICSPAGTTAAGLHRLERGGVRAALLDAVEAATQRSRALGA